MKFVRRPLRRGFGVVELLVFFTIISVLVMFGGIYLKHRNADGTPQEVKSLLDKADNPY